MYHLHLRTWKKTEMSGNQGRMKSRSIPVRGRVTKILLILTMSYYHHLGINLLTSFSFLSLLPFVPLIFYIRYNGWGVTLFDSLDTLWIMGLWDEFSEPGNLIRDFQFHATRVSQTNYKIFSFVPVLWLVFESFDYVFVEMRSCLFPFYKQCGSS